MADKNAYILATDGSLIQEKYHDNTDGTHSPTGYLATAPLPAGASTNAGAPSIGWNQVAMVAGFDTEIVPVRATRRGVYLINVDATNDVYIGGAGVTNLTGLKLTKGQTVLYYFQTTAQIKGYPSAGAPKVAFLEVYD